MDSASDNSVTQWLAQLKQGNQEAARKLWNRYFGELVRLARQQLGTASRRVADEEDVALSVFDALCRGAAEGRFDQLTDRDDLWRLLVAITAKKAVDQKRLAGRAKRGSGAVRGDSIFACERLAEGDFDRFASEQPSPSFLVMLAEQHSRLLESLDDDTLRHIARLRMEGFSNEEIGESMGISLRSVERKMSLIREAWSGEAKPLDPAATGAPPETTAAPDMLLAECPLFRAVPTGVLAAEMSQREFSPGEALMRQGEAGTSLMVVAEGRVEICVQTRDGGRHVIDTAGRGDVLGEMALLTREPRTADAIAVDRVRALVLAADRFHELAHRYPEVSVVLSELVAARLGKPEHDALTDKVLDRYRIAARLGRGGMGVVYRAEELDTGRPVALKMMSHRLVYHREALARFQREADIIQSLDHPSIVRTFGRFAAFHTYFLVLEYCCGRTLDEVLSQQGPFSEAEARHLLGQLAAALAAAHKAGVVHRDIKPANVMVTDEQQVKLMDFGLAEPVSAPGTRAGRIVGTPRYMAPEQRAGAGGGRQAEYFSFGCLAYELLVGRPLFDGGIVQEVARDFSCWQPPALRAIRPDLSEEMCKLVASALQLAPHQRRVNLARIAAWARRM